MTQPASPRLSGRELLGVALLGVVLALAMHWPLPLHMGRDIAQDLGDPLVQAWQIAWDGHALAHQPTGLFQANTFWPMRDSLAVSDALVGYAPAGLIGEGTRAAVARYDVLFLFAYALCFAGAWLLARELGANRAGAAVAGLAFAYAPWRLEQEGHMHVISSGGIPLALFLLVRGYRRGSAGTILAGWLVATWQFSLGFTLGRRGAAPRRVWPVGARARATRARTPRSSRGQPGRRAGPILEHRRERQQAARRTFPDRPRGVERAVHRQRRQHEPGRLDGVVVPVRVGVVVGLAVPAVDLRGPAPRGLGERHVRRLRPARRLHDERAGERENRQRERESRSAGRRWVRPGRPHEAHRRRS
ncbi:MAG TPA: hypothetical protein VGV90_01690, partial [Solirubrobacteraceae bacterium]|nr:hypothetical protein [Solirubrobacteraceae bacterium]